MIYYFHPCRALLGMSARTIAAVFVLLDVVSFVIQLIGGGMAGPSAPPESQRQGLNIYMAGISLQEFFVIVFIGLCAIFQRDMLKRTQEVGPFRGFTRAPWGTLLAAVYLSLSLITVRILYRLIEFSGGLDDDSPLRTEEVYFFVFEAVPMFAAVAVFILSHPGRVISGPGSEMPGIFSLIKAIMQRRKGRKQLLDTKSEEELRLQQRVS